MLAQMIHSQQAMSYGCLLSSFPLCFIQCRKDPNPVNGILASVKLIVVIPHKHAQSHFSQRILERTQAGK